VLYFFCFCCSHSSNQHKLSSIITKHFSFNLWRLWKTGVLGRMASPEEAAAAAAAAAAASPTVVLSGSNLQEGVVIQELSSPPLQGWKKKVCFLTNPKLHVFVCPFILAK
jgi:hypothetical protein